MRGFNNFASFFNMYKMNDAYLVLKTIIIKSYNNDNFFTYFTE